MGISVIGSAGYAVRPPFSGPSGTGNISKQNRSQNQGPTYGTQNGKFPKNRLFLRLIKGWKVIEKGYVAIRKERFRQLRIANY